MAPVTVVEAHPVTPAGYEFNTVGRVTEAVTRGDQLKNGASGWSKLPAGATEADGIALVNGYAGQTIGIGLHGEMDGFSGLTPGTPLYPSASVAGGLDTTVVAGAAIRVKADTDTRIRYNYV